MTKFEPGKRYKTRDGREAEVYRVDGMRPCTIIGAIKGTGGWGASSWDSCGRYNPYSHGPCDSDLMPPTPKAGGFVNVYGDGRVSDVFEFRSEADRFRNRIACIDLRKIDLTPFLVGDE